MKKYCVLFSFLLLLLIIWPIKAEALKPLAKKVIVIDAGHGAQDPGTIYKNIYEKDINLQISQKLKKELQKKGASVIMTRDGDYDLSKPNASRRKKSDFDNRIKVINNSHADMYISIHLNYLPNSKYYGPQVFYNKVKKNNKQMAQIMQEALNKNLKTKRKIKKIPSSTYMYDKINVSGILIECGFLSNSSERSKLITEEYQEKLAQIITKAINKAL